MRFKEVNPEVFVAQSTIFSISDSDIHFIKEQAISNTRKRARICAHLDSNNLVHEMFIAIAKSSYIQPHKHIGKSESFHIIEGMADVIIFDEQGQIKQIIELGESGSDKDRYYRLSEDLYHTLILKSPILVMHEVTSGPLNKSQTVMASFAPDEGNTVLSSAYLKQLNFQIDQFNKDFYS